MEKGKGRAQQGLWIGGPGKPQDKKRHVAEGAPGGRSRCEDFLSAWFMSRPGLAKNICWHGCKVAKFLKLLTAKSRMLREGAKIFRELNITV